MHAKDYMTPAVISVGPKAGVGEIAELLIEKKIGAVPVLDEDGRMLGIVSEGDLIRRLSADSDDRRPWWVQVMSSGAAEARDFIKAHGRTAEEVMTRNVVSVSEDTDIGEVAHLLASNRIKRTPVVRDGKVVGIISRANLLQALAGRKGEVKKPVTATDREIRQQVHDAVVKQGFASHGTVNVIAEDGIVELWGWVESEAERKALMLVASEVGGVREVRDHFGKVSPWNWGT